MDIKKKSLIFLILLFLLILFTSSCVSAADHTKVWVTQGPTGEAENSHSTHPFTSADGRYVTFESYANNLGGGSSGSGIQDIYVYDRQTKITERITKTPNGGAANGNSYSPSISADGRYVAFASEATNLGPGGSGNGIKDIYLYDRTFNIMTWITHSPNGGPASNHSYYPIISTDGTTIVFQSTANNLGPGGSENYIEDIFVYNRISGKLKWITQTNDGKTANGSSMDPAISADGRYIAFETTATNLSPGGNNFRNIFVYDNVSGNMTWITQDLSLPSYNPSISGDGLSIAYESNNNIYLYNMNALTTKLITKTKTGGTANGNSYNPSISGDGNNIAFETLATNLGADPNQTYGSGLYRRDIFVYDLVNDIMNWITKTPDYKPANGNSYNPSLNLYGDVISYNSYANNLGPGGTGKFSDVFMEYNLKNIITLPPSVSVSPVGGVYSGVQGVVLTTVDLDSSAVTYYTVDGSDPVFSVSRKVYSGPILIDCSTVLRFAAVDPDGNWSPNYSQTYTIKIPVKTVTIGSNSTGYVQKIGPFGTGVNKVAIIIGVHPREGEVHKAMLNAIKNYVANLKKVQIWVYKVVVYNPGSYTTGRTKGEKLANKYILPNIDKTYTLVIDTHGNGGNYKYRDLIFAPNKDTASVNFGKKIVSKTNYLRYHYVTGTSPPLVTIPIAKKGIPTLVFELYNYVSNNTLYIKCLQVVKALNNIF